MTMSKESNMKVKVYSNHRLTSYGFRTTTKLAISSCLNTSCFISAIGVGWFTQRSLVSPLLDLLVFFTFVISSSSFILQHTHRCCYNLLLQQTGWCYSMSVCMPGQ
jgi:hypothetical protein